MPITATVKGNVAGTIEKASAALKAKLTGNVQAFAQAVLADLVEATPKLSGQAAANWQVSINQAGEVFIEVRPRNVLDEAAVEDALTVGASIIEEFIIGDTLIIYNNAPYIQLLNQGYSPKAAAGFVQDIIERNRTLLSTGSVNLKGL